MAESIIPSSVTLHANTRPRATVHLDPDDTLASIRAKVEAGGSGTVELDVPFGTRALYSPAIMKALRHKLTDLGVDFSIRSKDDRVTSVARASGFRVVSESSGNLAFPSAESARSPESYRVYQRAIEDRRMETRLWLITSAAILMLGLGVAGIVGFVFLPSATVVLRSPADPVEEALAVTASLLEPNTDAALMQIHGFPIETGIEINMTRDFTEEPAVPGKKATGEVTFSNHSADSVPIPAGTRLGTSNGGVQFATTRGTVLSAERNSVVTVPVEAVEEGLDGNVAARAIVQVMSRDLAAKIVVINDLPIRGGVNETKRQIVEADYFALRQSAMTKAHEEAATRLRISLPPDSSFYDQAIRLRVVSETFTPVANEQVTQLSLAMNIAAQAVAFTNRDLNTMITDRFRRADRSLNLTQGSLKVQVLGMTTYDNDSVSFNVQAAGRLQRLVDSGQVKTIIAGRRPEEAALLLKQELDLQAEPEIVTGPFWVDTVPRFPWRVTVHQLPTS